MRALLPAAFNARDTPTTPSPVTTRAAAGVFDDPHAVAEGAALFRALDHRERHSILIGPGRVEVFELDDDVSRPWGDHTMQTRQRRVANGVKDGIDRFGGGHRSFDVKYATGILLQFARLALPLFQRRRVRSHYAQPAIDHQQA